MTVDLVDACDRSFMSSCIILGGMDENGHFHEDSNVCILKITPGRYIWLEHHEIDDNFPRVLMPSANLNRYCGWIYCAIIVYLGLVSLVLSLKMMTKKMRTKNDTFVWLRGHHNIAEQLYEQAAYAGKNCFWCSTFLSIN